MKNNLLTFICGAIIGLIAWGNYFNLAALSVLIIIYYFFMQNRLNLFMLVFGYHLASSKGLFVGSATYYNTYIESFFIWFAAAFLISLPYIILFSKKFEYKIYIFIIIQVLLILPPFGLISWVNPITSAGLFFPSFGFYGFLFLMLISILFYFFIRLKVLQNSFITVFILLATPYIIPGQLKSIDNIDSIISNYDYGTGKTDFIKEFQRQQKFLYSVNKSKKDIVLLPENALGFYNENSSFIWDTISNNKTVLAGAYIQDKKNLSMYDNVVLYLSKDEKKVLYKQRVPVLVSMWKPWSNSGAKANLRENPIVNSFNKKLAFFVCYEQLIDYTFFHSLIHNPDYLIGVSNLWWAKNTNIENIQLQKIKLYALLFNKPFIYSVNN